EMRLSLAARTAALAGLRPRRELELGLVLERRDRHLRPERRLRHRQVDGREDVVALAHEPGVRPDVDADVDVPRAAAVAAGMALARDADLLAVVDSGWDLDLERPLFDQATVAATLGTRIVDHAAGSRALPARLRSNELAEGAPRDVLHAPCAGARRARGGLRPRAGSAAAASRARDGDRERHLPLDAGCRLGQFDLHVRGD